MSIGKISLGAAQANLIRAGADFHKQGGRTIDTWAGEVS